MIQLAIITGVAGAGKTSVLSTFEENQYVVIDNIPLALVESLLEEFKKKPDIYAKVALAVNLNSAKKVFDLAKNDPLFSVIFVGLDCSKEVLLERFRLTRRLHPFQHKGKTLEDCIEIDKKAILYLRDYFTHYVDTSKFAINDLRRFLKDNVFTTAEGRLNVNFVSFGYKKSVPQDIETVFDVRILPNPYWVKELKEKTGLDKEVKDYIFSFPITHEFIKHVTNYLDYYLEEINKSNRKMITIGIACSGGQHRSVVIAEYLKGYYAQKYNTTASHRELNYAS